MRGRGQALVEFALIVPTMLFLGLGMLEAAMLVGTRDAEARSLQTVADYAAMHGPDSWSGVADTVLPGCTVAVVASDPTLIQATSTCAYSSVMHLVFDGLPITVDADAATVNPPLSAPAPTP